MRARTIEENAHRFLLEHGSAVRNALQVHARRMREAATEAPGLYGKVFVQDADAAERALRDLDAVTDADGIDTEVERWTE